MSPVQKPNRSKQDYATQWDFIRAVDARFGPLVVDLAASAANAKAKAFLSEEADALTINWRSPPLPPGNRWLNPPFGNISKWAAKACSESSPKGRVFMLTPASIGTDWFAEHVVHKALVLGLRPRLTFEGESDPYPKDLMLSVFGEFPGFGVWNWKEKK